MSWADELKSSLKSLRELKSYLAPHENFHRYLKSINSFDEDLYPIFIPLRIIEKILIQGPLSPLAIQFLPSEKEVESKDIGFYDPIGDLKKQVAPQLIHRYKNRVLFLPTSKCPINCRYCFRKNEIHSDDDLFTSNFQETLSYIEKHKEVDEIIFSGGDPFILTNKRLKRIINDFDKIQHVKRLRFHTRFPTILPSRFNEELIQILKESKKQIIIAVHANHIDEFDKSTDQAIGKLSKNFTLLSQSVLLNNVNTRLDSLKDLFEKFQELRVSPYYLHFPDQVQGTLAFQLKEKNAIDLYLELKKSCSGFMLPKLVFDSSSASGKIFFGEA